MFILTVIYEKDYWIFQRNGAENELIHKLVSMQENVKTDSLHGSITVGAESITVSFEVAE